MKKFKRSYSGIEADDKIRAKSKKPNFTDTIFRQLKIVFGEFDYTTYHTDPDVIDCFHATINGYKLLAGVNSVEVTLLNGAINILDIPKRTGNITSDELEAEENKFTEKLIELLS